jgi:hypothetical protein
VPPLVVASRLTIHRRHAAQAHSFFYCNDCCNGFSTQEAKNAYLPQCRHFCMWPLCVPYSARVSLTGDPQSQRHLRTQYCPTLGRVEDKHKLEFLKCTYRAVYPEGTEPSTCQYLLRLMGRLLLLTLLEQPPSASRRPNPFPGPVVPKARCGMLPKRKSVRPAAIQNHRMESTRTRRPAS